ncbi:ankyrin repeat-containing domain protein [Aspergillus karnatakaensis]|uniref:ankyrin repeat domain-containing protein n=1 Tax=Aspergillus karnatakaensis TaxID=1810916 RepID=UPI003CCDD631
MPLLALPNDILLLIAEQIPSQADISSFTKLNRRLYCTTSDLLHRNNIKSFNSSALVWAVKNNRIDVAERMLDLGADVDIREDDKSITFLAASEGHADLVQLLLGRGARYRYREGCTLTPLCVAASAGHTDVVRILLNQDEITTGDRVEQEPRRLERGTHERPNFWQCQTSLVEQLFETSGAGINHAGIEYTIPLFLAIGSAYDSTAEILIKSKNIDLDYKDIYGRTPLMWAISHNRLSIVTALLEAGADGNIPGPSGQTPLFEAAAAKKEAIVKLLLAHKSVDVNKPSIGSPNQEPQTPFSAAQASSSKEILLAFLLRPDIDPIHLCHQEEKLFQKGADTLTTEILTTLLSKKRISPNIQDPTGRTPLSHAAQQGSREKIRWLLSHGADPTLADNKARPPHFYAAAADAIPEFLALMATGRFSLDTRDKMGQTPLFQAVRSGAFGMARYLLLKGADPNVVDENGDTPLLCATSIRYLKGLSRIQEGLVAKVVKALIEYGADANVRDKQGKSPLVWALERGDQEVVGLVWKGLSRSVDEERKVHFDAGGCLVVQEGESEPAEAGPAGESLPQRGARLCRPVESLSIES